MKDNTDTCLFRSSSRDEDMNVMYLKRFIEGLEIIEITEQPVDTTQINTSDALCRVIRNITIKENLVKYIRKCNALSFYLQSDPIGRDIYLYEVSADKRFIPHVAFGFRSDLNRERRYITVVTVYDLYISHWRYIMDTDLKDELQARYEYLQQQKAANVAQQKKSEQSEDTNVAMSKFDMFRNKIKNKFNRKIVR